ncbi:hypothetical protein MASR1M31_05680 [Porphyromonadaceae bacterium]
MEPIETTIIKNLTLEIMTKKVTKISMENKVTTENVTLNIAYPSDFVYFFAYK